MSESKWKQIVGKTISESAYVSPDSLREDYKRVMVETTFAKAVSDAERELEMIRTMLKAFGLLDRYNIEIRRIRQSRKAPPLSTREQIEIGERIIKEQRQANENATNGGCQNGNCHRIVKEQELLPLLDQGWEIVKELSNGHIVVRLKA